MAYLYRSGASPDLSSLIIEFQVWDPEDMFRGSRYLLVADYPERPLPEGLNRETPP